VVGQLVGHVEMKIEQRNDNIPVASLSPVEDTPAASFGRVLKNRSFLLLWLAQLLSQPEILLGGLWVRQCPQSLCYEERPTRSGK
jgi:hypothetical protein